jgi:microcin C transport system substrate-binding protein
MEMQRQFELIYSGWGVGSPFPNPRPEVHSSTADVQNTNNISGFKNKRIDEICDQYDIEFDLNKRIALIRELDGILMSEYHYINLWYPPAQRIAYWNRFGQPRGTFSRIGDYLGSFAPGIPQLWWIDPEKAATVERGISDKSVKLPVPPVEDRYWQEYSRNKAHELSGEAK